MPYRICKSIEIESGHMLSKHPGACRFPHGHSRRIDVVLESDQLDHNDMVCDFKVLRESAESCAATWDHAMCMNSQDQNFDKMAAAYGDRVVPFQDEDPTTEVMARTLFGAIVAQLECYAAQTRQDYPLDRGVRVVSVRVWETPASWAEFSDPREVKSGAS